MKRWQVWCVAAAAAMMWTLARLPNWLQDRTAEQSRLDLAIIYGVHGWGRYLALALVVIAVVAVLDLLRRRPGMWALGATVSALVLMAFGAAAVHRYVTVPLWPEMNAPRYLSVAEASYLDAADMVLVVEAAGRTIAYPSAVVAYHHLVNDEVDGIPFLVSY